MALSKKIAEVTKGCVACGTCVKPCPVSAISVYKGLYADVEAIKCLGCGKCASVCPAGIIQIQAREADSV